MKVGWTLGWLRQTDGRKGRHTDILSSMARYQEYAQTDFGIQRIREWAKSTGRLRDNDVLISGDVDEILYHNTLNLLRWCEVSSDEFQT